MWYKKSTVKFIVYQNNLKEKINKNINKREINNGI